MVLKSNIIESSNEYFEYEPPPSYMMYERLCLIKIWYRLKEKYGLQFEESYLRLGGAHILECNIEAQTKRGLTVTVSAKIEGTAQHAFLSIIHNKS